MLAALLNLVPRVFSQAREKALGTRLRSTNNVDVVSMIGTIVFKGARRFQLEGIGTVTSYTLGCFSVMVASYERDEFYVLK